MAKNKPLNAAAESNLKDVTGSGSEVKTSNTVSQEAASDAVEASKISDITTPKSVYNTKKVAELVGDGGATQSGMSAAMLAANVVTFGGSADNVSGDASAITNSRFTNKSGNRPGRTIDTQLRHIDDVPAESYKVNITTIPNLRDGVSNVGYNGNYDNAHAISQKGSGGSPASNKFFRTLDLVTYDTIYFAEGQYNLTSDNTNGHIPFYEGGTTTTKDLQLGNYLLRSLNVTFDENTKKVSTISFGVSDITRRDLSEDEYRAAADTALRMANVCENDRLTMVHEAGDETKDNWSPLGVTITDATSANRMLKYLDTFAGDYEYISGTKLQHALSYQINKSAKDGMRKVGPMFEMCDADVDYGSVRAMSHTDETVGLFDSTHKSYLALGSSALYVAINDSVDKYNTKSKLLSLPLSFKAALSTWKQNASKLKVHSTLIQEFNRQEVFGKIDEDGSGITPYFLSDGAGLVMPFNINDTFTFVDGEVQPFMQLSYHDLRNSYTYNVYNFFVQGLVSYLNRHGAKICAKTGVNTLNIPVTSTTCGISLWDLFVCDAAKDIVIARQYSMELVLKYQEKNGHYPYSGVEDLDSHMSGALSNIGYVDANTKLTPKSIPLTTGARLLLPETFTPKSVIGKSGFAVSQIIMPFYFNECQFTPEQIDKKGYRWVLNPGDNDYMTFFDVRGGVTFNNMDRILALDPEQLKFCYDRMVTLPAPTKQYTDDSNVTTKVYKYSAGDDGMIVATYLAASLDASPSDADLAKTLTIKDIMSTPRELGLSFVAPAGIITPAYDDTHQNYRDTNSAYMYVSGPSFRLTFWHSCESISNELFQDELNPNQGVNFTAQYATIDATAARLNDDIGIVLSANDATGIARVTSSINPFMAVTGATTYDMSTGTYHQGEAQDKGDYEMGLLSNLKYMYTRIQLLPFIIDPWDSNAFDYSKVTGSTKFTTINAFDDFDFLHMYNVCGFRAGEYSGRSYDRNKARVEMGLSYVSDPYIDARI